jgi:hypothetical protein
MADNEGSERSASESEEDIGQREQGAKHPADGDEDEGEEDEEEVKKKAVREEEKVAELASGLERSQALTTS